MESKTCLENKEQEVTRKRMLISRLRMAIITMYQYVCRDAVVLPEDKKKDRKERHKTSPKNQKLHSVDEMMEVIKNHIEDLVMVISRVRGSEDPDGYILALDSARSHLRIDY